MNIFMTKSSRKPHFYFIKVGCDGVKIARVFSHDDCWHV